MKLALCQLNPVMGDIAGNTKLVRDTVASLASQKPDLIVFSELFIPGYPPRDLLELPWFLKQGDEALESLALFSKRYPGTGILVGAAVRSTIPFGKGLHNAAVLIADGAIVSVVNKQLLPSYDVFDETRYFDPGTGAPPVAFKDEKLGITICEDAWNNAGMWPRPLYGADPVKSCAEQGASLLINISGSPFHLGKEKLRYDIMRAHAARWKLPFVFVNQIGGNDELIFDGNSMALDAHGDLRTHLAGFTETSAVLDTGDPGPVLPLPAHDTVAHVQDALSLGLRDYMRKCGFSKALVGLSGGIDSAVTAALAAGAVGAANVTGVTMPSRYSSEGSVEDSRALARNLGIRFKTIPIEPIFASFLAAMQGPFEGRPADLAEENIQARIRGNILMALSNKFGCLLLTTGNKSELAVGYCTLYGDMDGGLSVISDLPKTMVYKVAQYINRDREIIPAACITKPPSAELRPNQTDQDTLPPYEVLDRILAMLVEEGKSTREVVAAGIDEKTVAWIARAIKTSEYKRRQAAPGLRVTPKAFGSGRRFPIAARYDI
jgi:NAD+ synthase (glutamine-hydrolysing)